jgi:alpha-tubulin suppressor-like RCC1 family protein
LLFHSSEKPQKHRFKKFPAPTLLVLDCLFDSGLKDSDLHGMGPLGTMDLHMLTDAKYLLPISTIMAWLNERSTITQGILPFVNNTVAVTAVSLVSDAATDGVDAGESATKVPESISLLDVTVCVLCLLAFGISRILVSWTAAKSLFDRGASMHTWKFQPILVAIPFLFLDVLYLNGDLTKLQVIVVISILGLHAYYRAELWNFFKRKYLLLCTQELHFYQPSAVRQLQRRTLLEFLDRLSTDDYGFMLMETAIRHGGNIRELARDTSVKVWDPAPSATAAWKLAFSLVTKSLRRQRMERDKKVNNKDEMKIYIEKIVVDMVYKAVETASGHGGRLRLAGGLQKVMNKRRAIRKLRDLAESRRLLRVKRRTGQLSMAPALLATAGGSLRAVREMDSLLYQSKIPNSESGSQSKIPALPAPPSPTSGQNVGNLQLSLNSQERLGTSNSGGGENSPLLSMPGELPLDGDDLMDLESGGSPNGSRGGFNASQQPPRGVYALSGLGATGAPQTGAVVLCFGDARRGQLGMEPVAGARLAAKNTIVVLEELRGFDPMQVEAAGVSSFVIGARGQIWSFGSNRAMELGLRKEVTQVNQAQRVKSLRNCFAVQVAGSSSVSGQAHTLVLASNGEVQTFGSSACGALGQGPGVTQTAPLVMRLSKQERVKLVMAGAHHSLIVTDKGQLYSVGDNRHGQLGHDRKDVKNTNEPLPVEGELKEKRVLLVACGDDHALATTEDGKLYAWGACANGQLGLGRLDDQFAPQPIREPGLADITSMAGGARHTLVVARNGTQVWAFGSNVSGQLGIGKGGSADGLSLNTPALVKTLSNQLNLEVTQVVAASSHSLAVTNGGEVFSFGDNTYGQLGFPPPKGTQQQQTLASLAGSSLSAAAATTVKRMEVDVPRTFMDGVARLWVPTRISCLSLYRVWSIATADSHTLALYVPSPWTHLTSKHL